MESLGFNLENSAELVEGQSLVWHQVFNFIGSMSLKCATELGIPDIIHKHGRPISLDQLVAALHVNKAKTDGVHRLMRILVNSGFFKKQKISSHHEGEGYVLTPSSLILVEDHPFSLKSFVLSQLDPIMKKPWHHLGDWLRNEDPTAAQTAFGTTFWQKKEGEPKFSSAFDAGMASDTPLLSHLITKECNHLFDGLSSIVDVGGGTGTLAKAIVDAFPHIHCTVLDFPHVVAGLTDSTNLKYIGGDMFEHIPPTDAIVMKWILHAWTDEVAVEILKRCKEAISVNKAKGGKIIIMDMTVNEQMTIHNSYETQLFLDMLVMTLNRGQERSEKEWAKIFSDAGFSRYKMTHVSGIKSIIEVFP